MIRAGALAAFFGLCGLVVTAAPRAGQTPQEPAPIFRGRVETVAIYATALDRYGEMVTNLDREDFDVYDDGKRQEVTTFVNAFQPITAILLIDTSASMTLNLDLERTAAEQFVIRMLPEDKGRVGSFSDRIDLSATFTSDRDALLRAIREGLHIGNPTKLWDALDETMTDLQPLGGRRVIMLLTDGMDTLSKRTADEVLARARTDELMVYAVQFRSNQRANLAELPLSMSPAEFFRGDPRSRNAAPGETLRRLAAQTGGGHFMLGQFDDVNATFTRVMQELHHQYVLGFTPQRLDGKVHTLEVKTNRSDITVRARGSYLAPKPNVGAF